MTGAFVTAPAVVKVAEVAVSLFLSPDVLNSVPLRVKESP